MKPEKYQPIFKFEELYDKYIPLVYGIAFKLAGCENKAEQIAAATFQNIYIKYYISKNKKTISLTVPALFKLTLENARTILDMPDTIINNIKNTPVFYQLFYENKSIDDYCKSNNLTRGSVMLQISKEVNFLKINR